MRGLQDGLRSGLEQGGHTNVVPPRTIPAVAPVSLVDLWLVCALSAARRMCYHKVHSLRYSSPVRCYLGLKSARAGGFVKGTGMSPSRASRPAGPRSFIARCGRTWVLALLLLLAGALPATAQEWFYTVRPGDSLWMVAERYLSSTDDLPKLQALNHISDPAQLQPGTRLRIPVGWLKVQPAPVEVLHVRNDATVVRAATGHPEPLTAGMRLAAGDRVHTGADSSVSLRFADGARLIMQAVSDLTLDRISSYGETIIVDSWLRLQDGRVDVRAAGGGSKLHIQTPAGVSSVRGTEFRVGMAGREGVMRTEVVEGVVGVEAQSRRRDIAAGLGTRTATGQPPEPPVHLLPPPDIAAIPTYLDHVPIAFSIPPLPGAVAYRLQIAPDPSFDALLFDVVVPTPDFHGPAGPDGTYTWRVRGIDSRGLEGLDASKNLTLNARPGAPGELTPDDGAATPERRPHFRWQPAEDASAYHFQLADNPEFDHLLIDVPRQRDSALTAGAELAPGHYFWRVASVDTSGDEGPFSQAHGLEIGSSSALRYLPFAIIPAVVLLVLLL